MKRLGGAVASISLTLALVLSLSLAPSGSAQAATYPVGDDLQNAKANTASAQAQVSAIQTCW